MVEVPEAGPSRVSGSGSPTPDVPPAFQHLSDLLEEKPEALARRDLQIQDASLAATKYIFDLALKSETEAARHIVPFMTSLQPKEAPKTRSMTRAEAKFKGKQKEKSPEPAFPQFALTPLDALHAEGDPQQVWAQLDLRGKMLCEMLKNVLEDDEVDDDDEETTEPKSKRRKVSVEDTLDDADEEDVDMNGGDLSDGTDDSDDEDENDSEEGSGMSELDALISSDEDAADVDTEHTEPLRDPSSDEGSDDDDALKSRKRTPAPSSKPHAQLDDGFFSLDAFNAEIEAAESRSHSSGRLNEDSDSDEEDEGDLNLFAPVDERASFDEDDLDGSTEPYYKDFFAPPSRKAFNAAHAAKPSKKRKGHQFSDDDNNPIEPYPPRIRKISFNEEVRVKTIQPSALRKRILLLKELAKSGLIRTGDLADDETDSDDEDEDDEDRAEMDASDMMDVDWDGLDGSESEDEDDEDQGDEDSSDGSGENTGNSGRNTISRIRDDLFADDDEDDGPSGMSTHEKRQAELSEQIRALEQENIGPKDWTLMGEATSRSRPANALLEQDLEFDRTMRPVPAITEERVASIEDLIKKRILDNNFDDVVRKLSAASLAPSARRGAAMELDDQKSKQSLAQMYEDDYVAASTGSALVNDRDGKLAKEHDELEKLWDGITYQLDALCNAHFTPKQPKGKITTISNVAAASIESALPTSTALSSMLAPEEVSARATRMDLTSRSEMTPSEKRAVHLRLKKDRKKKRDTVVKVTGKVAKGVGAVKKEKQRALSAVSKGRGVTVVGKEKGAARKPTVDGRKLKL